MAIVLWMMLGLCRSLSGIEIDFGEAATSGREFVPLHGFVSFEKGEVENLGRAALSDAGGRAVAVDFSPNLHWEDGSVRAASFRASVPAHRARGRFHLFPHGRRGLRAPDGIAVSRKGRTVIVETGCLSLGLDGDSSRFISSGRVGGRDLPGLEEGLDLEISLNGTALRPVGVRLEVRAGPASARALFSGKLSGPEVEESPFFLLGMRFLAGSGKVRCNLLIQGEKCSGSCGGVFFRIVPPWSRSVSPAVCHVGGSTEVRTLLPGSRLSLDSRPSGVVLVWGEEEVAWGKKGDARLELRGCRPGMVFDLPRFGRLHPWSLSLVQGGPVTISLLNERFDWEHFFSFQREFSFTFRKGHSFCAHHAERRLTGLSRDPARRSAVFADGGLLDSRNALVRMYVEVTGLLMKRLEHEWSTWDGFIDYGDYRKEYGIWANQEYDPAFGLLKRYLWTGSSRDLSMAESMLSHWLCFDRAGNKDPAAWPGVPWMHGRCHRSGRNEPGHAWLDGLLLFHTLTGEERHLQGAKKIGDYFAGSLVGLKDTELERTVSWSLHGLSALVEAGHEGYSRAMEQAAAMLRSRQVASGFFGFRKSLCEEESCYESNTWVTSGITAPALLRHFVVTGDTRSRDAALKAVRAIVKKGIDPETGFVSERLFLRTSDGRVAGRSGKVKRGRAALLAIGMARAYQLTGEEGYRQKASSLLIQSLIELRDHVPAYPGEDLAMLLRVGVDLAAALGASQ